MKAPLILVLLAGSVTCNAGWFSRTDQNAEKPPKKDSLIPPQSSQASPTLSQKMFGYTPKPTTAEKVGAWVGRDGKIQQTLRANPFTHSAAEYMEKNYQPPPPVEGLVPQTVRRTKEIANEIREPATAIAEMYLQQKISEAALQRRLEEASAARRTFKPYYATAGKSSSSGEEIKDTRNYGQFVPVKLQGLTTPRLSPPPSFQNQAALNHVKMPSGEQAPGIGLLSQFQRSTLLDGFGRPVARVESDSYGHSQIVDSTGRSLGSTESSPSGNTIVFDAFHRSIGTSVSSLSGDRTTMFDANHKVVGSILKGSFGRSTLLDQNSHPVGVIQWKSE